MSDMTVANEILRQLGGRGRVGALLGVTQFAGDETSLRVKFKAQGMDGINCFKVTLDPSDTYTVEFFKTGRLDYTEKGKIEDVYCDNLVETIETRTGLYLHF